MAKGIDEATATRIRALLAEGKTTNAIAVDLGMSWKNTKKAIADIGEEVELAGAGRPGLFNENEIAELAERFKEYIDTTDIPIVAEFAYQNGLSKNYFHDKPEFANLVKLCTTKKEAALEIGALKGLLNPTMAVFSLKQMGWTDKQQVEATNTNTNTNINVETDLKSLSDEELRQLERILSKTAKSG